jgi:hypothetical protein
LKCLRDLLGCLGDLIVRMKRYDAVDDPIVNTPQGMGERSTDRIPIPTEQPAIASHLGERRGMAIESLLETLAPTVCKESPVLGKAIPWKQVEGQFLRVKWCRLFASIQDGTIKPDPTGSYAALGVECPSLAGEAFIVVSSEVDFRHLWELYAQRRVADDEEVLLSHVPVDEKRLGRMIATLLPCLDIMVYPRGHLKQAYDPEFRPRSWAAWNRERARWRPSASWD